MQHKEKLLGHWNSNAKKAFFVAYISTFYLSPHFEAPLSRQCFCRHSAATCSQEISWQLLEQSLWQENRLVRASLVQQVLEQSLGIFAKNLQIQFLDFSLLTSHVFFESISHFRVNTQNPRLWCCTIRSDLGPDVRALEILLYCFKCVIISAWCW